MQVGKAHRASFEDRAKVYQRVAAAHLKMGDPKVRTKRVLQHGIYVRFTSECTNFHAFQAAIEAYNKAQMEQYDKAVERKIKNLELEAKKKAIEDYIKPEVRTSLCLPSSTRRRRL